MVERGNSLVRLWPRQFQSGQEKGGEPPLEVGEDGEVVGLMIGGGRGGVAAGGEEPHLAGDQLFQVAWKAGGTGGEEWVCGFTGFKGKV